MITRLKTSYLTYFISLPDNASRLCLPDGQWHNYSNYSNCRELHGLVGYEALLPTDYTYFIYFTGYSISLIALFISLSIFAYFK